MASTISMVYVMGNIPSGTYDSTWLASLSYQNGIDFHVDWGTSKFVSKTIHAGLVGYVHQQLTCDSDAGARLSDFKGAAVGIGPQIRFMFSAS